MNYKHIFGDILTPLTSSNIDPFPLLVIYFDFYPFGLALEYIFFLEMQLITIHNETQTLNLKEGRQTQRGRHTLKFI